MGFKDVRVIIGVPSKPVDYSGSYGKWHKPNPKKMAKLFKYIANKIEKNGI